LASFGVAILIEILQPGAGSMQPKPFGFLHLRLENKLLILKMLMQALL
jgi:hypothetical protein